MWGKANVSNALLKRGFCNVYLLGLAPLEPAQGQLVGPAYTLRFMPAREDLDTIANYGKRDNLHRVAIEHCPRGAVLVIDAMGSTKAAAMGNMMACASSTVGSKASSPTGATATRRPSWPPVCLATKRRVGECAAGDRHRDPSLQLNGQVGCAGVPVYPGDVIFVRIAQLH